LLEPGLYTALVGLKYLALAGMAIGAGRLFWQRAAGPGASTLLLLAGWTLLIFGALLRWMQITPASWGRLLYPALPAMGVLAAWGLAQFAGLGTRFPAARRWLVVIPWLATIALFLLAAAAPFPSLRGGLRPPAPAHRGRFARRG
jgi:hypothetical protein